MAEPAEDTSEDAFLGGRLILRQPRRGHRAGHDAMLLAASTAAKPGDRVIEFGAGVGAAGLALATRVPNIDLALLEIDRTLADLAQANAAFNKIPARVIVLDITAGANAFIEAGIFPDGADAVLMNPPFNDPARHRSSPNAARARAHVADDATLADWVHSSRRALRSGGEVTMIWRADGLEAVLATFDRGFGSLVVQPVHATPDDVAIRILLRAVKGGRAPLRILPGLVISASAVRSALQEATSLPLAET